MDIELEPGSYVVAVSGGVDSMALLHILSAKPGLRLTVAHFDHGIRPDSESDRQLVQQVARQYGLPFVYHQGHLGAVASEATARQARYDFLRQVQKASAAKAIITAHHQDDALETAILNLLRGTGRKGLSSLDERPGLRRPLLGVPKQSLVNYAQEQGLVWHEDSTNRDTAYLRNYIRWRILPRFTPEARQQLWQVIEKSRATNRQIDTLIVNQLHTQQVAGQLDRLWFDHLPHKVALEVMATWLRAHGLKQLDKRLLERLVVGAKTARQDKHLDAINGWFIEVGKHNLALRSPER